MPTRTIQIVHTISQNDSPARDGAENRRTWIVPLDTEAAFDGLKILGANPIALGAEVLIHVAGALQARGPVSSFMVPDGGVFGDQQPMPILATRTDLVEIEAPLGTDLQLFGRVLAA